ncbi:MAG: CBS domain-containing protein [Proteobacteria bacterium]|nr:CBS domain-containing protein [Pseudomonadota bacterium]
MKKVTFYNLDSIDELATPYNIEGINLDSPATMIFTDFKYSKPLTIENSLLAVEAEKLMQNAHVRLKFILNENNHFLGIVSLEDLSRQNILKKVAEGCHTIEELRATDLMSPREKIKAINYTDIVNLSINDVLHALQENHQQHCLVLEPEKHRIRGIISASDIARKLHIAVNIESNSSFIEIYNAIKK